MAQISKSNKERSSNPFEYTAHDFVRILRNHCERGGKSRYAEIAAAAFLDPAYGYRLIKGERLHPSPNTLLRLALGLRLTVPETDELLMAAGYAPLVVPGKGFPGEERPERAG